MPFFAQDPYDRVDGASHLSGHLRERVRPITIQVVDHDAAVRDALSFTLDVSGFGVQTYGSAGELLRNLPIERDGCLLIEFDLEDMTGIELLGHLYRKHIKLPAIIMSARLRPLVFDQPKPPGIVTILQKPFGQDALLRSLRHALTDT